ncbi:helix-turn-helix transcriptional regulator [Viridibacillus sp. FSL E2-0187]|jgi:transcriptional regulator with XRE-family HTH domain|uniref:Toxin-antitoxin system n=1 Tax=Viridibacillus arvi TaxID=263475 RepID=A0A0M0LGT8_9BACL|nr:MULTISPECIES: helix-turn-helix transcriptional regulator [Viridibacillus]KOO49918.1 toxin-antitoxin system [Viridibacillus arvi]QOV10186.1 helix-turn-helix transcriptional regulator [Viridibacillus sp. JNUCC-6]
MFDAQAFGMKLKELRELNDYSMLSLGRKIGTSASRIKSWEMGESVPSASWIVKLSGVLQVSADELLLNVMDESAEQKEDKDKFKKRKVLLRDIHLLLPELNKQDLLELYTLAELKAMQKEVIS